MTIKILSAQTSNKDDMTLKYYQKVSKMIYCINELDN